MAMSLDKNDKRFLSRAGGAFALIPASSAAGAVAGRMLTKRKEGESDASFKKRRRRATAAGATVGGAISLVPANALLRGSVGMVPGVTRRTGRHFVGAKTWGAGDGGAPKSIFKTSSYEAGMEWGMEKAAAAKRTEDKNRKKN